MPLRLAFAIAATDALLAAFLVAHGVVTTLRAEVAGHTIRRQHHGVEAGQMVAAVTQPIAISTAIPIAPMTTVSGRFIR